LGRGALCRGRDRPGKHVAAVDRYAANGRDRDGEPGGLDGNRDNQLRICVAAMRRPRGQLSVAALPHADGHQPAGARGRDHSGLVTATDSTGSATATSAPVAVLGLAIKLIRPRAGSLVSRQRFGMVVRVNGDIGQAIRVKLTYNHPGPPLLRSGPSGKFRFTVRAPDPQKLQFAVQASAGGDGAQLRFPLTVEPPLTAIQEFAGGGPLIAPGCRTCLIRDPAGDDFGSPPDITSASSTYRNGWLIHTITTYDPITSGGSKPCLVAQWGLGGPGNGHGFTAGCFDGPTRA
jgi:hypothetical protein